MMKLLIVLLLLIFSVNIFGDCTECDLLKGGNCETCSQNVYSFGSGLSYFDNNMSYSIDLTYSFAYFQSINLSLKQTDKSFNDLKLIPQLEYIFYFLVSFDGGIGHDIYNENILYHLYLGTIIPVENITENNMIYISPYYRFVFDDNKNIFHEFGLLLKFTINDKYKFGK